LALGFSAASKRVVCGIALWSTVRETKKREKLKRQSKALPHSRAKTGEKQELIEQVRRTRLRQFADGLTKDLLVKQPQRESRGRERRQGIVARLDDVPQKSVTGRGVQVAWMAFAMKDDEGGNPAHQGFDPRCWLPGSTELVEQSRRLSGGERYGGHGRSLLEDVDACSLFSCTLVRWELSSKKWRN
jgi:hypothetical protein